MFNTLEKTLDNGVRLQTFLPNFRANHVVFIVILMAELLALVLTLTVSTHENEFWTNLAQLSFLIQWIALSTLAVLGCFRDWMARFPVPLATLAAFVLAQLVTLGFSLLAFWILDGDYFKFQLSLLYSPFILRNLAISSIVSLMALRYFYIQHQWQNTIEAQAQARFQALQARIRPHFLFNSLNTIASLITTQPQHAEQAIVDLSELFRSTLDQRGTITLQEELAITRHYLSLEHLRLGDRLQVKWQLDDNLPLYKLIPALILQPLVENAVYHGIQCLPEGGQVTITAKLNNRNLEFVIVNPLPQGPSLKPQLGHHLAQDNVQQRLRFAYGETSRFRIQNTGNQYRVMFTIPKEILS
jgi:two-component system sensor histidine kinase AlgZ